MMLHAKQFWFAWLLVGVALVAFSGYSAPALGQGAPAVRVGGVEVTGVPDDWTHRHTVFSNPGTEQEAIQTGHHAQWQKVVNDPRYVIQQLKKNLPLQGPAAVDAEYRARWESDAAGARTPIEAPENFGLRPGFGPRSPRPFTPFRKPINQSPEVKRDWSQALGGPGLAASHDPAKYSFSTTAGSCSDYIVYPTGATGSSTQATIMAFTNLYVGGGCGATNPTVYWSFFTPQSGGTDTATATTSPVLSLDGKQVAFVEEDTTASGTPAYLVILRMAAAGTSHTAPAYPGHGLTYYASNLYLTSCTASAAPCYTTLKLLHGGTAATDTNSAPYYIYSSADELFVGDDSGYMHEVTGVFSGTPTIDPTGWPVQSASATIDGTFSSAALTSPVYDAVTPNYLFVNDASGYLHSITTTGTPTLNGTSGHMECRTGGFTDSPVIDEVGAYVYIFAGDGCDTSPGNSYINRFPLASAVTGTATALSFGNASTNTTASSMRAGAFDNEYYTIGAASGHLFTCENGRVYRIVTTTTPTIGTYNSLATTPSSTSICSPVTEFLGSKASTTIFETGGISATSTSVTVTSATNFATGDYIQIDSEIMLVGTVAGNSLPLTRHQLGTTAATHADGATVLDIQDWIFMSLQAGGSATGCGTGCLYNFNVTSGAATGTPASTPLAEAGGTSGVVIDNLTTSQTGGGEIYFSTLTGDTAVQATQVNP